VKKLLLALAAVIVVGTVAVVIALMPGGSKVTVLKAEMEQAVSGSGGIINRQIEVSPGDIITLSLYAEQASAMHWSASIDGSGIVSQQGDVEYTKDGPAFDIGSAGHEVWTFKALAAGETTITMTYYSIASSMLPPPAVNTLVLVVVVA
jgi:predicted secreted protein